MDSSRRQIQIVKSPQRRRFRFVSTMVNLYSVCGEWKSNGNNQWKFSADHERGASLIMVDDDISFKDLLEMLLERVGNASHSNRKPPLFVRPENVENIGSNEEIREVETIQ